MTGISIGCMVSTTNGLPLDDANAGITSRLADDGEYE